MDCIGYMRCSTQEQASEGVSLDAQRAQLEAWAKREGTRLVSVFADESVSGGAPIDKRPGLLKALEAVKRDTVLVVVKRDRLARDAFLSAWLEKEIKRRRGRIVSIAGEGTESDDPSAMLMRRLVDAFSEYERSVIRARTRAAMQHKRANGQLVGTIPYGFDLDPDGRTLVANETEQAILADIRANRSNGWTLQRIATDLSDRGIPTKKGLRRWSHQAVAYMLEHATKQ